MENLWFSTSVVLLVLRVLLVQDWLWRVYFALGFVVNILARIWVDFSCLVHSLGFPSRPAGQVLDKF